MPRLLFLLFLLLTACGDKQPPAPKPAPQVVAIPDEPPPGKLETPATIDFRILVDRRKNPEVVEAAVKSLEESGHEKIVAPGLRWFPIWGVAYFAYSGTSIEMAARNPEQFINDILHLVAAEHRGVLYVLTWDTPDRALKADEGNWAVTEAFPFGKYDPQNIKPPDTLVFSLDNQGARRLGAVTSKNIGQTLTIVVEGKLIMASKIDRQLDRSGVIAGGSRSFTTDELAWLRRKLLNLPDPPTTGDPETPETPETPDKNPGTPKDSPKKSLDDSEKTKPTPEPVKPPLKDPA